jgi:hypothetical protein
LLGNSLNITRRKTGSERVVLRTRETVVHNSADDV